MKMETQADKPYQDKKILVVEDDPYTSELISNVLATRGFNVVSVGTGEEAIEYTKSHLPDLIVLDLLLPQIDGWEVCSVMRRPGAKTAKIPILVTSVLSRFDSILSDKEMKSISFSNKPFESSEFVAEVERIFDARS